MELWLVRHGERADEVSGVEGERWRRSASARQRWYDPPLTLTGHHQARQAGHFLGYQLNNIGFTRIYTSPLLRAVETSINISKELDGLPVQVLVGLCECASAVRLNGVENIQLLSDVDIRRQFPQVNLVPRDASVPETFLGACDWLASSSCRVSSRKCPGSNTCCDGIILAVAHREGIRELVGQTFATPYCSIGRFSVEMNVGGNGVSESYAVPVPSYRILQLLSSRGHILCVPAISTVPN
ncbi:unnamed protein product [Choristocarpus tenellus]